MTDNVKKIAESVIAAIKANSDDESDIGPQVTEQPSWIPDWVWRAYSAGSYSIEGADELIRSKDAAIVWAAIARRQKRPAPMHAARLFSAVRNALNFNGPAVMGDSERKKRLSTIVRAVKALQRELAETQLHLAATAALAESFSTAQALQDSGFVGSIHLGVIGGGIDAPSFELGAGVAAEFLISDHFPELLEAVALDAAKWASEATVQRPNKPTAARTFFIRRITQFFHRAHGEPLRSPTLAITELFFDCENMTPADIARIAPVR